MKTYYYVFGAWTVFVLIVIGAAIRYALATYVNCAKCGKRILEIHAWGTRPHTTDPKLPEEPMQWYCKDCL